LIRFGGVEQVREGTRDEFRAAAMENFARDCRFGWRALRRAGGFLSVAVLTLATRHRRDDRDIQRRRGVLLRPLLYPDQDRLVDEVPTLGVDPFYASPAICMAYRDHNRTFDAIGHWNWDSSPATITGAESSVSRSHSEISIAGRFILDVQILRHHHGSSAELRGFRPHCAPARLTRLSRAWGTRPPPTNRAARPTV
jgi:hypothetical protein